MIVFVASLWNQDEKGEVEVMVGSVNLILKSMSVLFDLQFDWFHSILISAVDRSAESVT